MQIPKSFKLFATEWRVVWDDKRMEDQKAYGLCDYGQSLITLTDKDGVRELSEGIILDCFYHEKVHAILDTMHERELSENEKFVDLFAKLLRQSDETAEY